MDDAWQVRSLNDSTTGGREVIGRHDQKARESRVDGSLEELRTSSAKLTGKSPGHNQGS